MKVVTFGELMLRLNTINYEKFIQSKGFNASYAGSEANVAVSLANFGIDAHFVTVLPNNDLGKTALANLRFHGVNDENVRFGYGRMGIYFLEVGYSQRPSKVIYDRNNSAFSLIKANEIDWDIVFNDCSWFHFSGITPALSDNLEKICLSAIMEAKRRGIKVSCDLNYRNKLWSKEKASKTMISYMNYIDILIGNEEDAKVIFNYDFDKSDATKISKKTYEEIICNVYRKYKFDKIYFSLRESYSSNRNGWSGISYDGNKIIESSHYEVDIRDRLGAGDSFAAGVIYSELNDFQFREGLEFAVASSCLKHSIRNDFNLCSEEDVLDLINSNGNSRIKR